MAIYVLFLHVCGRDERLKSNKALYRNSMRYAEQVQDTEFFKSIDRVLDPVGIRASKSPMMAVIANVLSELSF